MAWHEISRDEHEAPRYTTRVWINKRGDTQFPITKEKTGTTIKRVFVTWRCGGCRALAVTSGDAEPGKCLKCK